jgi:hypothetical protein
MNKAVLVERLLAIEQDYAALEERWLQLNEEVLSWRLRAERTQGRAHTAPLITAPDTGL